MNIVSPIEGYERGVCTRQALLTGNENVATQICKVAQRVLPEPVSVFYRLEEGAARAEGARNRRDNDDGFRGRVREDI